MTDSFVRLKSSKISLLLLSVNLTCSHLPVEILGTSQDKCLLGGHPFLLLQTTGNQRSTSIAADVGWRPKKFGFHLTMLNVDD